MLSTFRLLVRESMSAFLDPFGQQSNLRLRESGLLIRHPGDRFVRAFDRLEQQAFGAVTSFQRWPILAPFDRQGHGIEPQVAFLLLASVTLIAMLRQQRLHLT